MDDFLAHGQITIILNLGDLERVFNNVFHAELWITACYNEEWDDSK